MLKSVFYFVIFPGFLFTAVVGLLVSWIDRKVTARVQWRVGPPWWQNFADFVKLLGKETIIPQGTSRFHFITPPLLSISAITLVSTLLWVMLINPHKSFLGDLIVVVYLLMMPAMAVVMGGAASGNPLASMGASREMKLVLGYELPFVLALIVPIIKTDTIRLGEMIRFQAEDGVVIGSWSGIIAFLVAIVCMQAKLTLVPFDIPEAETEIMSGPYIEYSGPALAMFKLTRAMMLFVLPVFLVLVFWGGFGQGSFWSVLLGILKYVVLLVVIVLIRNTNPRLRIDQAMRFFWGLVTGVATLAIILALIGA
ncbi:MAG TPA: NADH-quinone oxidoreductase subunit H [Candidatus Latescibacteria bacterium]|nr:NADH-quinone oxidoreductase subunit H [Candidatus Latescibacterota bacterium]